MRILQQDLVGYPFTISLARELARRGHEVVYAYCASVTTNPRGPTEPRRTDPSTLRIVPIELDAPLDKQNLFRRYRQEREYGTRLAALLEEVEPEVVLSSNAPLDSQAQLLAAAERRGARFVFWLQDLIGPATDGIVRKKLPIVGGLAGRHYLKLEADLLRRSSAVVQIADDFQPYLEAAGVTCPVTTIANWAPIEELPVRPRDNDWARATGTVGRFTLLYAGTLGRKHPPDLLVDLAQRFAHRSDVLLVVVNSGRGAGYLRSEADRKRLVNLIVVPFVSWDIVPDMMGAADVLLTLLGSDASRYSVPSKVLSQMCAKRALLAALDPASSLCEQLESQQLAAVASPNAESLGSVAEMLVANPRARVGLAQNARTHAEGSFRLHDIAARFESLLADVVAGDVFHAQGRTA